MKQSVRKWDVFELQVQGPDSGNPFLDVRISATFSIHDRMTTVDGFYDGDGAYIVRFMPGEEGSWNYHTSSNVPALDGIAGAFVCTGPVKNAHGPVRVAGDRHFAHADGTRFIPLGTTAYAWAHQKPSLVEKTIRTLGDMPFNKIRMCVFPKHYDFNHNDPPLYAFERRADGSFDNSRFNPAFWRHFDGCVRTLRDLSIEADIILFHPYDRWGFSDMGAEADDRYLRYAVARLSAYRNVWWSLANEYDFMKTKKMDDWDRFCRLLVEKDPYSHLRSIHNGLPQDRYDHNKPWITHVSLQFQDDNPWTIKDLHAQYAKPLMLDECGYEGDIQHGWGNLPAQEHVCRQWTVVSLGGHPCAHGETYCNKRDELWWAKGGAIKGTSPQRLVFLKKILDQAPGPLFPSKHMSSWDFFGLSTADNRCMLIYFGRKQPSFRPFSLPEGNFRVDLIDTWNMTVERLGGTVSGECTIRLPRKQFMALRFSRTRG